MRKIQYMFGAIAFLCFAVTAFLGFVDRANYYVKGYDVDCAGRVYIARMTAIEVYDDCGKVNSIRSIQSDGYLFFIRDDTIMLYSLGNVFTLDLNGNVLSQVSIEQSGLTFSDFNYERRTTKQIGEDIYQSHRKLGGFTVEWTCNGNREVIFRYDFLLFQIMHAIAISCTGIFIVLFFVRLLHGKLKWRNH